MGETNIVSEIDSLADYVSELGFTRIWKQTTPSKYTENELMIRFMSDSSTSETGYHNRIDREYQVIYTGESERACIEIASELQRKLNNPIAIRIKDLKRFLRLESFSMSRPFKTEDGEVFAIIGVLNAHVRVAREFEAVEKMNEVSIEIK